MQEAKIALLKSAVEMMTSRQFECLPELFAPDVVRHDLAGAYPGVTAREVEREATREATDR